MLADCFAAKLDYAAPEHLDWRTQRWPLLQQQLATWSADVVLLQEVDVTWCACAERVAAHELVLGVPAAERGVRLIAVCLRGARHTPWVNGYTVRCAGHPNTPNAQAARLAGVCCVSRLRSCAPGHQGQAGV